MELKIYIDRIKDGHTYFFKEEFPASLLLSNEPDLSFPSDITVSGEAYLAGDHLIVKLKAKTTATVLCSVCNKPTTIPLQITDLYHTEPLESCPSGIFDFGEILREDFLLELPHFSECTGGHCPERAELKKYCKPPEANPKGTQFPFSGL